MNKNYYAIWTDKYTVHSYEVDIYKKLTMESHLRYFQESAWNHAEHLDVGYNALIDTGKLWVLSQLIIIIENYSAWGDTITLRTWARGKEALFAFRDFEFLSETGKLLAHGSSAWLVIDSQTRRPQRPDPYLDTIPLMPRLNACKEPLRKVPVLNTVTTSTSFQPYYSDLDFNFHVNNTRYLKWVVDSYPLSFFKNHRLKKILVNYLAEATYGDKVEVLTEEDDHESFLHAIRRLHDSKELCRLSAVWEKVS